MFSLWLASLWTIKYFKNNLIILFLYLHQYVRSKPACHVQCQFLFPDALLESELLRELNKFILNKLSLLGICKLVCVCRGLCDMKQIGKLNSEQFALSMWLINLKLKGKELPQALTPEMIPPSARTKVPETVVSCKILLHIKVKVSVYSLNMY